MKPVLANLGFILQIAGLLTILPILAAFYYNEPTVLIPFFITAMTFLCGGFLLNALAERKTLDLKSSCILISITFVFLGLIGAIPYIYINAFNDASLLQRLTNGFFESISGYTTTGFSFFLDPGSLPKSLLLYRSLTELIGGVGIIFILLSFFYPNKALESFAKVVGVEDINGNLKKIFAAVMAVYSFFIVSFFLLFYVFGFKDVVATVTFIIDTLTGGFQPSMDVLIHRYLTVPVKYFILLLMFIGSVNFVFHYRMFTFKFRKALTAEVLTYLGVIVAATVVIALSGIGLFDSLFHVISMSSETGYDYLNIPKLNDTVKSVFLLLMILGPCSFSMGGGIRMQRVVLFFKSIGIGIKKLLGREVDIEFEDEELNSTEIIYNLLSILLFVGVTFIAATIFSTTGTSFFDSLFEVSSAISTNGFSTGATNIFLPLQFKWLMIALMIFGRVEMIPFLVSFYSYPSRQAGRGDAVSVEAAGEQSKTSSSFRKKVQTETQTKSKKPPVA